MCGVTASLRAVNERACRLIDHRGTESSMRGGIYHRRLPIVGLGSAGDQPVKVGANTIAFVGEVLDFRDTDPGAVADVDTVVRSYLEAGEEGLAARDGFWSVVAVNEISEEMTLFTDYLSQKPLYYRADHQAVSSELDSIASYGPVTPDEIYFASVVKWGYCPEPWRTPYREVRKTLPGEAVTIDSWGRTFNKISDPLIPRPKGDLKSEIVAAIRRRVLSSDVPVACLLSGGLDSSIVYTIASRYGSVRPYFVYHGEEPDPDELRAASIVAGGYSNLTVVRGTDVSMEEGLDYMQEPVDLGSLLPQVALSRAVQETVVLTGDGADELFGGYGRSKRYDSQWSDVFHELPCWHLPRLDRVMMRHCCEVRSPFLARGVAGMALALPRDQRTGKKILRDLFRDDLPAGIADQPKIALRTMKVALNREVVSAEMVKVFRMRVWG